MPDDPIPSLASLRRKSRRAPEPSLFDAIPAPTAAEAAPQVTAADIIAEQSRSLNAPKAPTPPRPSSPAPRESEPAVREQPIFTVSSLVRQVRSLVERSYTHLTVDGEISNWRPSASGHCYFTLKDRNAQLSVVLFRRQAQLLRFRPKDGDAVRLTGSLSVYESRGQMQLIAESMQPLGLGALLAALQALKDRLRREGLFENHRPLPPFPRRIGIVTSLHGAALRDIVKVCRRRHAAVNLLIYPAAVQGPNAARELAAGIRWFSAHAQNRNLASGHLTSENRNPHPGAVDVVLLARGGGSFEDLHAFNDEALVRAIAACTIPVLTGIGHATDSVLADAAADLCAPTPSAAAELVTASVHQIHARLARLEQRLHRAGRYNLLHLRQRLSQLSADSILRRVHDALNRRSQRLDELTFRADAALNRRHRTAAARLARLDTRLQRQSLSIRVTSAKHRLDALQHRLDILRHHPFTAPRRRLDDASAHLESLSPLRILDRGYALVYLENGSTTSTLLRSAADAPLGSSITAQLAHGRLRAKVTPAE